VGFLSGATGWPSPAVFSSNLGLQFLTEWISASNLTKANEIAGDATLREDQLALNVQGEIK
jgi:hypothetical protein